MHTGLDPLKTDSNKVVHKAGEFLGNKIADAITKWNGDKIVKQEPVEKIIRYPTRKKRWNLKKIKTSIIIKI